MDSYYAVSLSILAGESGKYSTLLILFVWIFPSPSVQDQITVPIPLGIIYFPPIFATPLDMMSSVLSVNMSSSDHICASSDLSTMNVYPEESNTICSEYYACE